MTRYDKLQANMPAIKELAQGLLDSQFFKLKSEGAALVVATELFVTGESPMEYQRRNGFINGTPYIPYDAAIAAFEEAGGEFKCLVKTENEARVELTWRGHTKEWSLTWEDAAKETFPYGGKGVKEEDILAKLEAGETPPLKAKYRTPRSRAIMLFARLADDSIRSTAASVIFGRHAKEVVEDIPTDEQPSQPAVSQAPPQTPPTQQAPPQSVQQAPPQKAQPEPETQPAQQAPSQAEPEQVELNLPPDNGAMEEGLDDPMTDALRSRIITKLSEVAQQDSTIVDRVKQRIADAGLKDLYSLTISEGERLLDALSKKQVELWADSALEGHAKARAGNELAQAS